MSADTRLRYACDTRAAGEAGLAAALERLAADGLHGAVLASGGPHLAQARERPGEVRERLDALCLEVVVDAGPLPPADGLDPLREACALADRLRAEAVVLAAPLAGPPDGLVQGLRALVASHGHAPYALALRPRPGSLVEDVDAWDRLHAQVPGLALALGSGQGAAAVPADRTRLRAVVVEALADPRLPEVLQALVDVTYDGLVAVDPAGSTPADAVRALLGAGG